MHFDSFKREIFHLLVHSPDSRSAQHLLGGSQEPHLSVPPAGAGAQTLGPQQGAAAEVEQPGLGLAAVERALQEGILLTVPPGWAH